MSRVFPARRSIGGSRVQSATDTQTRRKSYEPFSAANVALSDSINGVVTTLCRLPDYAESRQIDRPIPFHLSETTCINVRHVRSSPTAAGANWNSRCLRLMVMRADLRQLWLSGRSKRSVILTFEANPLRERLSAVVGNLGFMFAASDKRTASLVCCRETSMEFFETRRTMGLTTQRRDLPTRGMY